jgi:hypothetical protein
MPFPAFDKGFVEATYPLIFNVSETSTLKVEKIEERGQPAPKPVEVDSPQTAPIKNEIAKVIQASMQEFNLCYEQELKNRPALMGKVIVWAVIDPKGNVNNVQTKFTSLGSLTAELCLNYQFSKLKFPNAADNKIIEVNYPFSFGLPKK